MTDIEALIDIERNRLLEALDKLDHQQWNALSLCAGCRVRDVVVHLLMPYHLSLPRFQAMMEAAGFNFNKMADQWATGRTRTTTDILDALCSTKEKRFNIPGAPPEAPLCATLRVLISGDALPIASAPVPYLHPVSCAEKARQWSSPDLSDLRAAGWSSAPGRSWRFAHWWSGRCQGVGRCLRRE